MPSWGRSRCIPHIPNSHARSYLRFFFPWDGSCPNSDNREPGKSITEGGLPPSRGGALGDKGRSVLAGEGEKYAKAPLVAWLPSWPFRGQLGPAAQSMSPTSVPSEEGEGQGLG